MILTKIFIILLGLVTAVATVCPNIEISVDGDSCDNVSVFNEAFEKVYKAVMNWEAFYETFNTCPPYDLHESSLMSNAVVVEKEEAETEELEYTKVTTTYGGYTAARGNYDEAILESDALITTTFSDGGRFRRFLRAMQGEQNHHRMLYNCPHPDQCAQSNDDWCCIFCPCARRLLLQDNNDNVERRFLLETDAASSEPESLEPACTNVCDWVEKQDYPGCLSGATLTCQFRN